MLPEHFSGRIDVAGTEERGRIGGVNTQRRNTAAALTVAGSDSGGGAGTQADLKVFHSLGVFGTSAITCLTAQNPSRVTGIEPVSARMVTEQIERVLEAFPVRAAKTGMLYEPEIIAAVARVFSRYKFRNLVVDPVMIASSGARLLKPDGVAVLTKKLLPLALVVTPNRAEAEVLLGKSIGSLAEQRDAARLLAERFGAAVVVKGGHVGGARVVDVLFDGRDVYEFVAARVPRVKTHGTGCVFSAALAANLALGFSLVDSVARAKSFVTDAIRHSLRVGRFRVLQI